MRKLVIDARWVRPGMTGVGVWAAGLARAAGEEALRRGDWSVVALVLPDRRNRPEKPDRLERSDRAGRADAAVPLFGTGVRVQTIPYDYEDHPAADWWLHAGGMAGLLRRLKADVFFSPTWLIPWKAPCPVIATLLDFAAWRCPETFPAGFRYYVRAMMHVAARRADALVVISRAMAREAENILRIPAKRLNVIYPGVGGEFHDAPPAAVSALSAPSAHSAVNAPGPSSFAKPYFLWIGAVEPRKSLGLLLRAFEQYRDAGGQAALVVAGGQSPRGEGEMAKLRRMAARLPVHCAGYMERPALIRTLAGALALAYPSRYEGFGIPALEAMACGVPVIASRAASMPEVLGDDGAAYIRDSGGPGRLADLTAALHRMEKDADYRQQLARAGLERAKRFTWDNSARALLDLAETVRGRQRKR